MARKTTLFLAAFVVACGGALFVPVTAYVQASARSWQSLRFVEIEATFAQEIRKMVQELHHHGVRTAVIVMHSFRFTLGGEVNGRVKTVQDEILVDFVPGPEARAVCARQSRDIWQANSAASNGQDFVPETGRWMTYSRAWQRLGGDSGAIIDGETGLLVDGNSPAGIVDAINGIPENPGLARRLGQNSRRRVCSELTWDHSAERIKRLVAGHDGPRVNS